MIKDALAYVTAYALLGFCWLFYYPALVLMLGFKDKRKPVKFDEQVKVYGRAKK